MSNSKNEISMVVCPATPKHCRQSEASILPFKDGRLFLAYTDYYAGVWRDEGSAVINGKWSCNEGKTWSKPFLVQENIGKRNVMEASLLRLPSGRVLLSFLRKDSEPARRRRGLLHVMIKHSDDECKTWSEPREVTRGSAYWCGTNDRFLRLSSGRILISVGEAQKGAHVWISDDDGESWRISKGAVKGKGGYGEPTVVELADGSVKMFMRNKSGFIHIARSTDGGETWGELNEWGPPAPPTPCMVRRVPGSADLILIWSKIARSGLNSAVSHDGGQIWEGVRALEEQDGWPLFRSHCYPSLAFLNGNAHMTYWETHRYPGCERLFSLVYRRLPVRWFYDAPKRRPALFNMKEIVRKLYFPATVYDGEKRKTSGKK